VHVICAAFWLGGMLFIPLILVPDIKKQPNRVLLLHKTGIRFRFYGWLAIIILFFTGTLNMHFSGNKFKSLAWWTGMLNLLLAMIIAFLGVALSRGGF